MTFIWLKYHFTRIVYSALLAGFQFAKPKWHERDRWGWLWRALVRWEFRLTDAQNKYRALKMVTGPVGTDSTPSAAGLTRSRSKSLKTRNPAMTCRTCFAE
jgi:hypothetical protein